MAKKQENKGTGGLSIVQKSIDSLIPYARNARTHSDDQVAQIAGSIREFGFVNPVLVDQAGGIIAGHGRILAARKLGMTEVPAIELGHLTETQKRALILADNKISQNAGWDVDLLRVELADLKVSEVDLGLTGFSAEELAGMLGGGLPSDGGQDGDPRDAFGGATSMARSSVPFRFWRKAGLLTGDVLDFGCGQEEHEFEKYDAFTHPDPAPLLKTWDRVVCNYVLNVQPAEHLISQICAMIFHLVRPGGFALISTRNDIEHSFKSPRGYQVAKTWEEWSAILSPFFQISRADTNDFFGFICERGE
jgi:hypothetical protein